MATWLNKIPIKNPIVANINPSMIISENNFLFPPPLSAQTRVTSFQLSDALSFSLSPVNNICKVSPPISVSSSLNVVMTFHTTLRRHKTKIESSLIRLGSEARAVTGPEGSERDITAAPCRNGTYACILHGPGQQHS